MIRWLLIVVALFGASGVGIGAAGAHALPKILEARGFDEALVKKEIERVETGVRYQLFHTAALFALSLSSVARRSKWLQLCAGAMTIGVLLFSGGLFFHVFANNEPVMKIVPYGGTILIGSWLAFGVAALLPFRDEGTSPKEQA